ncbi:hypothetical protein [Demequina subtropica]|uniref:hypothetical protein n=1 Tax=Demequina subtropica TaxID=1638989 RepID=UPI0007857CEC|nr:hypothetical protein [Demequina subtropica]
MTQIGRLRLVGYWAGDQASAQWPVPDEFVDREWDPDERGAVALYLKTGIVARAYMGYTPCRMCGCNNGSVEFTDGVYVWPEGFSHYIADHEVRPPQELIDHVHSMIESVEGADRDEDWWMNRKGSQPT